MIKEAAILSKHEAPAEKVKIKEKENLKQRAYLNSVSSFIEYGGTQIVGLVVSPFIVGGLGKSMYGIWQMLMQMTGYAKFTDSRATQVLKWTVAKKKDQKSEEELRRDVSSVFFVIVFTMPIAMLVGAVISWYAPNLANVAPEYYSIVRIACSLLMLTLVLYRVFDLFESVLRGMNLGYKRMWFRAGISLFGGLLKVLAITLGFGLIGLGVVQVLISITTGVTIYLIVRKHVHWFGFGKTNFKQIMYFSRLSGWNMANTTTTTFLLGSDKLLLGMVAGPVLVSSYALTSFMPLAIQGLVLSGVSGIMPGIGKLLGSKEYSKITMAWGNVNGLIYLLAAAFGVTVLLFNEAFLNIWVGDGHFSGNVANALIMMMIIQDMFVKHDGFIINATLDLKKKTYYTVCAAAIYIALGYVFINKFGITGLCISVILGKFLLFYWQRRFLKSKVQLSQSLSFLVELRPLLVMVAMLGAAFYLTSVIPKFSLVQLFGLVPITFLLSFFIFYWLGLPAEIRKSLMHTIRAIKFFKSA